MRLTITAIVAGGTLLASAQPPVGLPAQHHSSTTLFVAQVAADKVVPPASSVATATGAFLVSREQASLTYDITYQGLQYGPPQRIALHNFGVGGNGHVIHLICGEEGEPCPDDPFGNLTGTWADRGQVELDNPLLGEFASGRVYLEVVGGNGLPEIRGQLEANGAMVPVRNFVAHLAPIGQDANGVGTAVLSEVYLPEGRVSVFYEVTIAGTSGAPQSVALVGVPANPGISARNFTRENTLRNLERRSARAASSAGTFTGTYEIRRAQDNAVFASRMLEAGNNEVGISVRTNRFPDGELYGVFAPVN